MLIKIDISPNIIKKIERLIKDGKYSDIQQFLIVALLNQIQEEMSRMNHLINSHEWHTETLRVKPITKVPIEENKKIPIEVQESELNWRKKLQELKVEDTLIESKNSDLIWYFYNRFFPVKVVIYQLAKMMVTQKNWIELEEIQDQGFDFAEKIATKLKEIEASNKITRNKKLSTGLPTPKIELMHLRGTAKRKKEDKLQRGKTRFINQIIGRKITKEPNKFTGACFDLGLIGIQFHEKRCYVSLTELGKKFALIENPILDKDLFQTPISEEEISFIFHEIYPKFPLENKIVKQIIDWLEKEPLTSYQLDKLFKKEGRKYFTQERIGTMGRLSELQIVDWKIDHEGKSQYTLNREKLALLT